MQNIAIIIPCFNESKRLSETNVEQLLHQLPLAYIFFVDDGSTDQTAILLNHLAAKYPAQITIIQNEKNIGKAASIQKAAIEIISKSLFQFISYADADFSAPVSEFKRLYNILENESLQFVIASRLKILNASINRSTFRHIVGRVISTIIDSHLKLGIYDTQCGLKMFSISFASKIFKQPFYTTWLFDVEILARLKKENLLIFGKEVPLKKWEDTGGSKLNINHFIKVANEIRLIYKHY